MKSHTQTLTHTHPSSPSPVLVYTTCTRTRVERVGWPQGEVEGLQRRHEGQEDEGPFRAEQQGALRFVEYLEQLLEVSGVVLEVRE